MDSWRRAKRSCKVPGLVDRPPSTYEPSSSGGHEEEEDYIEPYFGDLPGLVQQDHFCIGGININNLPLTKSEGKNEELFQAVLQYDIDVLLMQELGVNWSAVSRSNSWKERATEWINPYELRTTVNHNRHDTSHEPRQWGGTGILTLGKLAHYSAGAGSDKSGL